MTTTEKNAIIDWASKLSDREVEEEYYSALSDSLGSEAEAMYERGYDVRDIQERKKYEKYISEKADILESICAERGIKLWLEH